MFGMGVACAKTSNCLNLNLKKIRGKLKCQNAGPWVYKKIKKNFFLELLTYYLGSVGWICQKNGNQDNRNAKASFIKFKNIENQRNAYYSTRSQNFPKKIIFFRIREVRSIT
jgi:hypothetical protein